MVSVSDLSFEGSVFKAVCELNLRIGLVYLYAYIIIYLRQVKEKLVEQAVQASKSC